MLDSRLKLLSDSSIALLHFCPRKYQLRKLWPQYEKDITVHTEYGKMFGEGIQRLLAGCTLEEAILSASTLWSLDIYAEEKAKTFWNCINAIERFDLIYKESEFRDYEVLVYNGRPATELHFAIKLYSDFLYTGFIDIVLKHKHTGKYLVVDAKTSNSKYVVQDKYKNSPQNIGYSIVIDTIDPGNNQLNVLYYEYLTERGIFESHYHEVDYLQRANWIRDLYVEIEKIKLYNKLEGNWPMHGHNCTLFNRACEFIENCTMKTENLVGSKINTESTLDIKDENIKNKKLAPFDIIIDINDVINTQKSTLTLI